TMRFPDELRSPAEVGLPKKKKAPPTMVRKFETLIGKKSKREFSPRKLEDEETARLLQLVKKKQAKPSNVVLVKEKAPEEGKVIDLVQVLKRSLAGKAK
ncbi:MAG: hypothetical protein ACREBG_12830, partial [Pyrinomonadaceae bacterium]